jgi:prepilin-type N-terminal cleavage/methylation domain-containing protein
MKAKHNRGFSMVEVLVATALLAIILLALFGLVTAGLNRSHSGRMMTEGALLAEAIMERINVPEPHEGFPGGSTSRTRTWTKTGATTITEAAEGVDAPDDVRDLLMASPIHSTAGRPAVVTVTMTPVPSGNLTNSAMVRIVVDVTWWDRATRPRRVYMQALNIRDQL